MSVLVRATPCQVAAIEALEGPQDHLKYMVEQYRLRRDYVMRRISEIPGLSCHAPAGTFYAFIDISQLGMPCEEFAMKLLEERQVVVVPGTALWRIWRGIYPSVLCDIHAVPGAGAAGAGGVCQIP